MKQKWLLLITVAVATVAQAQVSIKNSVSSEFVTVSQSGRIGINNTSPSYPLDISGQVRLQQLAGSTSHYVVADELGSLHTTDLQPDNPLFLHGIWNNIPQQNSGSFTLNILQAGKYTGQIYSTAAWNRQDEEPIVFTFSYSPGDNVMMAACIPIIRSDLQTATASATKTIRLADTFDPLLDRVIFINLDSGNTHDATPDKIYFNVRRDPSSAVHQLVFQIYFSDTENASIGPSSGMYRVQVF
jgi:hypothetical protein